MFKFSEASANGLRKLGRDVYNVAHPKKTNQQQSQTTLPNTSGTPTVINNIYNNIPPTQILQVRNINILKAIFYSSLLTIVILGVYHVFTNPVGLSHMLQQGVNRLHEILTTLF